MLLLAEQYLNTGRTDGGTSQILDRLRNTRPEEIASCLIHGDCTTDNILFEGTTLKTFIDFPYPKINPAFHGKPGGRLSCVLETHDLNTTVEEIKRNGGKIVQPATKQFYGGSNAIIADPDGNEFVLIEESENA